MHLTCNSLMYVSIDITHYGYSSRFSDFIFKNYAGEMGPVFQLIKKNRYNFTPLIQHRTLTLI